MCCCIGIMQFLWMTLFDASITADAAGSNTCTHRAAPSVAPPLLWADVTKHSLPLLSSDSDTFLARSPRSPAWTLQHVVGCSAQAHGTCVWAVADLLPPERAAKVTDLVQVSTSEQATVNRPRVVNDGAEEGRRVQAAAAGRRRTWPLLCELLDSACDCKRSRWPS